MERCKAFTKRNRLNARQHLAVAPKGGRPIPKRLSWEGFRAEVVVNAKRPAALTANRVRLVRRVSLSAVEAGQAGNHEVPLRGGFGRFCGIEHVRAARLFH